MRFLLLMLCVFAGTPAFSQNNELLRSRGMLPPNIIGTAEQKKASEIKKRKNRNEVIASDQYVLIDRTADLCQLIAKSGRLMINDSLSAYANDVLDVLLKNDPGLRSKLCVYFYYSAGTNAITLDNGMIIIELGLMAHLDNEAQLAFILAHEVCHYRQNHFLKYLRFKKESRNDADPLSSIMSYSRELEEEADSMGFEIYKKAGFPLSEAVTAFDMLKYSDMPERQIPFRPSFFELGLYTFPNEYFLDSISTVEKKEVDEELSTHPSCDKRMDRMQLLLGDQDPYGNYFPVSQSAFNMLRLVAREECCSIYLESRDYGNAIYSAYALLQDDSSNACAKKLMAKALYNLAAYSVLSASPVTPEAYVFDIDAGRDFNFLSDDDFTPITLYSDVAGESQRLHYFLSQMDGKELAILALKWNWKIYREGNYQDRLLSKMCDNLCFMLSVYHNAEQGDFSREAIIDRQAKAAADTVPKDYETVRNQCIEKLKKMKGIEKYSKEEREDILNDMITEKMENDDHSMHQTNAEYCYRGFDELEGDSLFSIRFRENANRNRPENPRDMWSISEKTRKSNAGLGINNMYVMPPHYYHLKEIKRSHQYRYDREQSAALQQSVQAQLATTAKTMKKGYFLITPQVMDSTRMADYNTYCLLQQWLEEETSHSSNSLAMNLSHAELADSLASKLGTQYVMVSTIVCEKQKRIRHVGSFVIVCIIPYTLPLAVLYGVVPRNRSHVVSYVYDIKTGGLVFVYEDFTKNKATAPRMNLYYTKVFHKTSNKPSKK